MPPTETPAVPATRPCCSAPSWRHLHQVIVGVEHQPLRRKAQVDLLVRHRLILLQACLEHLTIEVEGKDLVGAEVLDMQRPATQRIFVDTSPEMHELGADAYLQAPAVQSSQTLVERRGQRQ